MTEPDSNDKTKGVIIVLTQERNKQTEKARREYKYYWQKQESYDRTERAMTIQVIKLLWEQWQYWDSNDSTESNNKT